jgi:type 1 glutamine amidotransferase
MIFRTGAAALGLGLAGCCTAAEPTAQTKPKRVLFFSKSSGFEHDMIKRKYGQRSKAENILADLGDKHGIMFTFSKDGSLFTPEYLSQFDAYFFYTTGVLTEPGTDKQPPMTPEGKQALFDAIHNGKGFIGTHSATDTFHKGEGNGVTPAEAPTRYKNYGEDADPYCKMIGAEFIRHGSQQKAHMRCVDKKFPGMSAVPDDFAPLEEWYSLKDFAPNLHVLLVQETGGMKTAGPDSVYDRKPYPATWARMYGQGRVFYTSMGHRDDVWTNPVFQSVLTGGIAWAVRNVDADVTPNIKEVTPNAWDIPPEPEKPAPKKPAAETKPEEKKAQ